MDAGVQGIVDQVVGPKIQQIQPDVENILYKMFGVEKPDSNDEEEEMSIAQLATFCHSADATALMKQEQERQLRFGHEPRPHYNSPLVSPERGETGD